MLFRSQLFGKMSSTEEIESGENYFQGIVDSLAAAGVHAELAIEHGMEPRKAIVSAAKSLHPDLIVMGAHGHRGIKDIIFGNTIDAVRHEVAAPVLVVGSEPGE